MMKRKILNSLILAALSVPAVAMADTAPASPFSGNVSLTTDYLYRGITQTDHHGAIQGGFDYVNPNGVYVGTWGSNISWLTDVGTNKSYGKGASLELDTYAGYRNSFATDYSYDVGFLRYNYGGELPTPGTNSANTNEIYGLIGWKWLTAKYSYSLTNLFGFTDSSGSGYFDLSGSYTLADNVTLGAHYGKQSVKNNSAAEYSDYNVKASMPFGAYTWAFMISKTNLTGADKAKGVLSVSHSM